MNKCLTTCMVVALLAAAMVLPKTSAADEPEAGNYLVLFDGTVPEEFPEQIAALEGTLEFSHPAGIAVVSGLTEGAAAQLGTREDVSAVEADGSYALQPILTEGAFVTEGGMPEVPTDPTAAYFYTQQWNMRAVHADSAWAEGRLGSPEVTVAIVDTGIDYLYPDLAGRVDLARSASFVPSDDALVDLLFPGRHYVTDLNLHGTAVAAIVSSNAYVLAGVTAQTTLVGVKVCNWQAQCDAGAQLQGFLYAVDIGADVINLSLADYWDKSEAHIIGLLNRVFNYANQMGVTVVVSAGNDSVDLDHDRDQYKGFCNAPNVICVSATGPTGSDDPFLGPWYDVDAPAWYTNFGSSAISVSAPGGTEAGYVLVPCSTTSLPYEGCQNDIWIINGIGTSMAAPHVSGLAALVIQDVGRNPGQVKTRIQRGADDLGRPGVDPYYGKGRIDVAQTLH